MEASHIVMGHYRMLWNVTERRGALQNVTEVLWIVTEHYRALQDVMEHHRSITELVEYGTLWNRYGKNQFCRSLIEL